MIRQFTYSLKTLDIFILNVAIKWTLGVVVVIAAAISALSCTPEEDPYNKESLDSDQEYLDPKQEYDMQHPEEKTFEGNAGITFSVQPGDTLRAFVGEKMNISYQLTGEPGSYELEILKGRCNPANIKGERQYASVFKDGRPCDDDFVEWDATSGHLAFSFDKYYSGRGDDVNGSYWGPEYGMTVASYRFILTPIMKTLTYPDGTVEAEKGEPQVYEFFMEAYEIISLYIPDSVEMNVRDGAEGEHWGKIARGFIIGSEVGSTVDLGKLPVSFRSAIPLPDPDLDILSICHVAFKNDVQPSWLEVDGLTLRVTEENPTEYNRVAYLTLETGDPFPGERLAPESFGTNEYGASVVYLAIVQRPVMKPKEGFIFFKDPELKHALLKRNSVRIDTNGDREISPAEALAVKEINIKPGYYNITDPTGLEYFTNVETFIMPDNDIKDLSVMGTYHNLEAFDITGCDSLDCTIDLRGCKTFFTKTGFSRTENVHYAKYVTQLVSYDIRYVMVPYTVWDDPRRSTDFSRHNTFSLLRQRTAPGNIICCFIPLGFLDVDYEDGTMDKVLERYVNIWRQSRRMGDLFDKTSFYVFNQIAEERCDDWPGVSMWESVTAGDGMYYTSDEDRNANRERQMARRKVIVKRLFEEFCLDNKDKEDFLFVAFEISNQYPFTNFYYPYWFYYFNETYRTPSEQYRPEYYDAIDVDHQYHYIYDSITYALPIGEGHCLEDVTKYNKWYNAGAEALDVVRDYWDEMHAEE